MTHNYCTMTPDSLFNNYYEKRVFHFFIINDDENFVLASFFNKMINFRYFMVLQMNLRTTASGFSIKNSRNGKKIRDKSSVYSSA